MFKFTFSLIFSLFITNLVFAQYYFKDIINCKQTAEEMRAYKNAKIKKISVNSFEPDGEISKDFYCEKKISKDFRKYSLYTKNRQTGRSLMICNFDEKGRIIRTYDSSENVVTTTKFVYNEFDELANSSSKSISKDDDFHIEITESHIYQYKNQIPTQLLRIKNGNDTTLIIFSTDEKNNLAIEKNTKTGEKYYYYYDDAKHMTDIVHLNEFKNSMVPDYIFDYNDNNQIVQMNTSEDNNGNYYIWKYEYENDLKKSEKIFSNKGEMAGMFEYEYEKR